MSQTMDQPMTSEELEAAAAQMALEIKEIKEMAKSKQDLAEANAQRAREAREEANTKKAAARTALQEFEQWKKQYPDLEIELNERLAKKQSQAQPG